LDLSPSGRTTTLGISRWCGNGGQQCCRATGWHLRVAYVMGWCAAVMRDDTASKAARVDYAAMVGSSNLAPA